MKDRPVFSTNPQTKTTSDPQEKSHKPLSKGPCRMRLEKNGRGGKTVTVLFDLPMTEDEAQAMRKTLQDQLGCGGTYKDGTIELRGDVREKIKKHFAAKGLQLIASGG